MKIITAQNGQWLITDDSKVTSRVDLANDDLSNVDISKYRTHAQDIAQLYALAEARVYDLELARQYVALKRKITEETKPKEPGKRIAREAWSGSTSITKQLSGVCNDLFVLNDGSSSLTLSVNNGFTFTLKPGETFDEELEGFQTVTVTASGPYRAYVREVVQ